MFWLSSPHKGHNNTQNQADINVISTTKILWTVFEREGFIFSFGVLNHASYPDMSLVL
jgi:hypothetical protein